MRPLDVGLSDEAIEEARAAFTWYGERNPRAAAQFLFELDEAIGSIAEFPDAWPPYLDGTRRKLLRRFPFALVYRCEWLSKSATTWRRIESGTLGTDTSLSGRCWI